MAAITLKNIPEPLYDQLKVNAATHRRSLNSELIYCLEQVLLPKKVSVEEQLAQVRALRAPIPQNKLDVDDIAAAIHEGRA